MKTNAGPTIAVGTRTRVTSVFLPPPLKFRTVGFPQYGFKREVRTAIFAALRDDLYAALAPALAPYGPEGHVGCLTGAVLRSALVHRPLARQRVVLSRQVSAYYGLIRASRLLPPIYALDDGSLPFPSAPGGKREGPQFTLLISFFRAVFRTPADQTIARGCYFIARFGLPHVRSGSASASPTRSGSSVAAFRGCKVRFMLRRARIASPAPARAFTFELSPPESPQKGVEYNYAGKSANSRDRSFTGKTSSIMGCDLALPKFRHRLLW